MKIRAGMIGLTAVLGIAFSALASAQDLQKGVTDVCNGERIFIDSCNIRDTSDTSTCMVGHPDTVLSNGLIKYTYETRGALKKLFPTCKQPTADEVARAKAFEKKQNDAYEANVKKATEENDAIEARAQAVITGKPAQTPEEKAIARCISAGRLPATCPATNFSAPLEKWSRRSFRAPTSNSARPQHGGRLPKAPATGASTS